MAKPKRKRNPMKLARLVVDKTDHHDMKQRYRHCALVEYLTEYHAEQMRRERADHISGFAWICCPSGRNFSDDEIKRLYEVADFYSVKLENEGN